MSFFANNSLDVHVLWAIYRRWDAGQTRNWPADAHTLWLLLEGEVELWSDEKRWSVRPSQIVLWPRNLPRRIVGIRNSYWLTIGLSATSPSHFDLLSVLDLPGVHTPQPSERLPITRWMENLIELDDYELEPEGLQKFSGNWKKSTQTRPAHFNLIEDCMARAIFGWCWGAWASTDLDEVLKRPLPDWLLKTLDRIREDPAVSITALAKLVGFSPAQFRRLFHQNLHQSPQQYLLNYRLEIAQSLLVSTDLSVTEVAVRSGFPTPTNFMNLWKRTRGLSALQYRLARRNIQGHQSPV